MGRGGEMRGTLSTRRVVDRCAARVSAKANRHFAKLFSRRDESFSELSHRRDRTRRLADAGRATNDKLPIDPRSLSNCRSPS